MARIQELQADIGGESGLASPAALSPGNVAGVLVLTGLATSEACQLEIVAGAAFHAPAAAGVFTPGLQMLTLGSPATLDRRDTATTDATTMVLGQSRSFTQLTPVNSSSDLASPGAGVTGITPAFHGMSLCRSPCQSPLHPRVILSSLAFFCSVLGIIYSACINL